SESLDCFLRARLDQTDSCVREFAKVGARVYAWLEEGAEDVDHSAEARNGNADQRDEDPDHEHNDTGEAH
ncbi:uncharacterized protein ACA1_287930, partial [Acanthamoeba castellanii str. Neff]